MAKRRVIDMEKRRDKSRRYAGYHCRLQDGRHVDAWVSVDELEMEFHGIDLKTVCKLAVERAAEAELTKGEVMVARGLLTEVENREHFGRH